MPRLPDRWEDYSNIGEVIANTRLISFKVPLGEHLCRHYPNDLRFTPQTLLDLTKANDTPVGLVIDLTNTARYYKPFELTNQGVQYAKIFVPGHVIPSDDIICRFYSAVDAFLEDPANEGKLVGVHCTHGVNRTGYVVCRYMIEKLGIDPDIAIEACGKARGYPIERENYLDDLKKRSIDTIPVPSSVSPRSCSGMDHNNSPRKKHHSGDRHYNGDSYHGGRGHKHDYNYRSDNGHHHEGYNGYNRSGQQQGSYNNGYNRGGQHHGSYNNGYDRGGQHQGSYNNGYSRGGQYQGSYNNGYNRGSQYQGNYNNEYNRGGLHEGSYNSGYNRGGRHEGSYNSGYNRGGRHEGSYNHDYNQDGQHRGRYNHGYNQRSYHQNEQSGSYKQHDQTPGSHGNHYGASGYDHKSGGYSSSYASGSNYEDRTRYRQNSGGYQGYNNDYHGVGNSVGDDCENQRDQSYQNSNAYSKQNSGPYPRRGGYRANTENAGQSSQGEETNGYYKNVNSSGENSTRTDDSSNSDSWRKTKVLRSISRESSKN